MAKKENIRTMFDNIAESYDSLNHIMSLNVDKIWRARAIRKVISTTRPQKIMDLACGTGDFSIAIAKRMAERSHVTGVDLSEGMLAVMKTKVKEAYLQNRISIEQGEGELLRFADNSFDVVTIAFGIRNFEDREQGLREVLRVLKPGGKICILELSEPANPIIRSIYRIYFTKVMPFIGGLISGNKAAYKYLPASVINFPQKKEWMAIMKKCGFSNVSHRAYTLGMCRMYIGQKAE